MNKERPAAIFFGTVIALLSVKPLLDIIFALVPFWYDPARDLLAAVAKFSLLGPPTGFPGLYYGPYWYWWLKIVSTINPNPEKIAFLALFLPYVTVIPILLWKMRSLFGLGGIVLAWSIFASYGNFYLNQIWNPHLAPFLFFVTWYFLYKAYTVNKNAGYIFLCGIFSGLIINFQLAFGVVCAALTFGFLIKVARPKKQVALFVLALAIIFAPLLLFELRHDWLQTKTFINGFFLSHYIDPVIYAIGQTKKWDVMWLFSRSSLDPFVSNITTWTVALGALIYSLLLLIDRKIHFWKKPLAVFPLLLYLFLVPMVTLLSFLSTKMPVWSYHFRGSEIPLILLAATLLSRRKNLVFAFLALYLSRGILTTIPQLTSRVDPKTYPGTLAAVRNVTVRVLDDAGGRPFSWVAYSPKFLELNHPEYDYLFAVESQKRALSNARKLDSSISPAYLIITSPDKRDIEQFVRYDAPIGRIGFVQEWVRQLPGGTWVVKTIRQ